MKKARRRRSTVVLRTITAVFVLLMVMVMTSCSSKPTTTAPTTTETTTVTTTTTEVTTTMPATTTTVSTTTTATTTATTATTTVTTTATATIECLGFDDSLLRMEIIKDAVELSIDQEISMEEAFRQMGADYEIVLQTREGYEKWLLKMRTYVAVQTARGKWVVITAWQPDGTITYVDRCGELYAGLAEDVLPEEVHAIYPFI